MDFDCVEVKKITKYEKRRETEALNTSEKQAKPAKTVEKEITEYKRLNRLPEETTEAELEILPAGGLKEAVLATLNAVREKGAQCCHVVKRFLVGNARRAAFSALCGGVVLTVAVSVVATTCTFAYEIKVGDEVIGTVPSIEAYTEAVNQVDTEVKEITGDNFKVKENVDIGRKLVAKGAYTQKEELAENLKAVSDDMVEACAIKLDGKTVFAAETAELANDILNGYKSRFEGETIENASFSRAVEVVMEHVPQSSLMDRETATEFLEAGRKVQRQYTFAEGKTLEDAAAELGVTTEAILAENDGLDPDNLTGKTVTVTVAEPILAVETTELASFNEEIQFETTSQEDPEKYQDETEVITPGENGMKFVKARVTKVNGKETGRQVLSEEVLKEPVGQIEKTGTKERPSPIGSGEFSQPYVGTLSSPFGARWGRSHSGIDIAGSMGDPIHAADNGTVIYSAFNDGGYGNLVIIDHGNGYQTYYGHNSELCVKVGDVVAKGDVIAKLGNTGRSTGPHCHFEVRKDGTSVDPMPYLNGEKGAKEVSENTVE